MLYYITLYYIYILHNNIKNCLKNCTFVSNIFVSNIFPTLSKTYLFKTLRYNLKIVMCLYNI